jgi:cytochrome c553
LLGLLTVRIGGFKGLGTLKKQGMLSMKRVLIGVFGLVFSMSAFSEVDLNAGQEKAETVCAACHGKDGNSVMPIWPKLAGQHANYLVLQMQAFKAGKLRSDPSMAGMMAAMSLADMENVAAFFSVQERSIGEAQAKNLPRGEALYRGGDQSKNISACIACHGPKGNGNEQAGFPALSGQQANYVVGQLQKYKSGERMTDVNHIMRDIASKMDPADMEAVANYISGLH